MVLSRARSSASNPDKPSLLYATPDCGDGIRPATCAACKTSARGSPPEAMLATLDGVGSIGRSLRDDVCSATWCALPPTAGGLRGLCAVLRLLAVPDRDTTLSRDSLPDAERCTGVVAGIGCGGAVAIGSSQPVS